MSESQKNKIVYYRMIYRSIFLTKMIACWKIYIIYFDQKYNQIQQFC